LLNGLKCPESYAEAIETLGRLLAHRLGSYGQKWSLKIAQPPSGCFDFILKYNFSVNISAWNLLGCCKTPKYTILAS